MKQWVGSHFHDWVDYYRVAFLSAFFHFQDFGSQKIQVCRDLNNVKFNKCDSSSQFVQVKRLYKVDA